MPVAPKDASVRARRNKSATRATLTAVVPSSERPSLPEREMDERTGEPLSWHALTQAWWADVWASPMAPEWAESDRHGVLLLAQLIDDFWVAPSRTARAEIAAEIRLQRQGFGLSPLDRRRLEWQIEQVDAAQAAGRARRGAPQGARQPARKSDPRSALHAV